MKITLNKETGLLIIEGSIIKPENIKNKFLEATQLKKTITINLKNCPWIHSATIPIFIYMIKEVNKTGNSVILKNLNRDIKNTLIITGLFEMVEIK